MQGDPFTEWFLIPRPIPFMEERAQTFGRIARQSGADIADSFLKGGTPQIIPAHSEADNPLRPGTPDYRVSRVDRIRRQGKFHFDDLCRSPVDSGAYDKGNRNIVEGKEMRGYSDMFIPDGHRNRTYRPLYWRTFRYLELKIKTGDEPLTLDSFTNTFCGYPYENRATFACSDPELEKIWEMGWRTLRLCTNETFFDCPYYEQLQYVGDTRVEALVMLYMGGDHRLVRNALQIFDESARRKG